MKLFTLLIIASALSSNCTKEQVSQVKQVGANVIQDLSPGACAAVSDALDGGAVEQVICQDVANVAESALRAGKRLRFVPAPDAGK